MVVAAAAVTTWVAAAEAATLGVVTKIEDHRDLVTIMEAISAAAKEVEESTVASTTVGDMSHLMPD